MPHGPLAPGRRAGRRPAGRGLWAPLCAVGCAGAAAPGAAPAAAPPFHVLLTGFGPFLNFTHNPTEAVARALGSRCLPVVIRPEPGRADPAEEVLLTVCWHAVVLPVNRSGATWTTDHLGRAWEANGSLPYHAVFHMGLEDSAKGLKLEVAAANVQAIDGDAPKGGPAVPGAEHLLATTVNIGWLSLRRLREAAPRARFAEAGELWSRDPGTFYCNEVYFRTLHFIRDRQVTAATGALLPAMFLHCPPQGVRGVEADAETVSQVVGHSLWATYLAPGAAPGAGRAQAASAAQLPLADAAPVGGDTALLGATAAVLAALAALAARVRLAGALRGRRPAAATAALLAR